MEFNYTGKAFLDNGSNELISVEVKDGVLIPINLDTGKNVKLYDDSTVIIPEHKKPFFIGNGLCLVDYDNHMLFEKIEDIRSRLEAIEMNINLIANIGREIKSYNENTNYNLVNGIRRALDSLNDD